MSFRKQDILKANLISNKITTKSFELKRNGRSFFPFIFIVVEHFRTAAIPESEQDCFSRHSDNVILNTYAVELRATPLFAFSTIGQQIFSLFPLQLKPIRDPVEHIRIAFDVVELCDF